MSASVALAEVVRGGFVEGRHLGSAVLVAADGSIEWQVGPVARAFLPRSTVKPVQALAMLRSGLTLSDDHLAIACASHSGEDLHVDAVSRLLAEHGLAEDDLRCPEDWPLETRVRDEYNRSGGRPSRLRMNCSGKHAAMLATCVVNGWDRRTYLRPEHPLQVRISDTISDLTDTTIEARTTDGCGAPLLSTTVAGLARAFGRLAAATDGHEAQVAAAIRAHPALVSGTTRDERALIGAVPGLIAKAGAEACYAVGLADGRGLALKIDDGAPRARPVVMAAMLELAGVLDLPGVDTDAVLATGRHDLYGGGEVVGEIRACF